MVFGIFDQKTTNGSCVENNHEPEIRFWVTVCNNTYSSEFKVHELYKSSRQIFDRQHSVNKCPAQLSAKLTEFWNYCGSESASGDVRSPHIVCCSCSPHGKNYCVLLTTSVNNATTRPSASFNRVDRLVLDLVRRVMIKFADELVE